MATARMSRNVRKPATSRAAGASPEVQWRYPRLVKTRVLSAVVIPLNRAHVADPMATAADRAMPRCARVGMCARSVSRFTEPSRPRLALHPEAADRRPQRNGFRAGRNRSMGAGVLAESIGATGREMDHGRG